MCVLVKTALNPYKIRENQLYIGYKKNQKNSQKNQNFIKKHFKNMIDCFSSICFHIQGLVVLVVYDINKRKEIFVLQ